VRSFLDKWGLWIGIAVLVAGVAAYTATRFVSNGDSSAAASTVAQSVPAAPQSLAVAKRFVATAVARKNLTEAWNLAAPVMRQNLTLAQWKTGTIPVQPYPVGKAAAQYTVVASSDPDSASYQVIFTPPPGSPTAAGDFMIELDHSSGKWLVSSWSPREVVGAHG
jgi:hypothetical protein